MATTPMPALSPFAPPSSAPVVIRAGGPSPVAHAVRISAAALIVVCLSTAPFYSLHRWVVDEPLSEEAWPYVYTMWGAALLGATFFVLDVLVPMMSKPLARSENLLVAMAPAVALALWALLSAFWTTSPTRTPHQAILMSLVIFTAMWFGYALTFRQQVWSLFIGIHLLTLPSMITGLMLESARAPDDSWVGLFNSPDMLGAIATLGIVVALGAWLLADDPLVRIVIGVCAGIDVVVALTPSSTTGWVALCGAAAAFALLLLGRGLITIDMPVNVVRAVGAAVVGLVVIAIPWVIGYGSDLIDVDDDSNGRREIWEFVVDSVEDRWLAGFGWSSFWDDAANRAELLERTGRTLDSAHSSFVDTLLYLGAVGLMLLLVVVLFGFGRTWWEALGGKSWAMAWWAAVGMFAFITNVMESMMALNSIFWVLLIAPGFAATRYAEVFPALRPPPERSDEPYVSFTYQ
jgi:O-antigen ligase